MLGAKESGRPECESQKQPPTPEALLGMSSKDSHVNE